MQYSEMTDARLVGAALCDDCEAFGELVRRHHRTALAAAYRTVPSSADAEDAVQDAFIAAWLKLDSLREPSKFGAWVCRIAKNKAKKLVLRAPDLVPFEELYAASGENGTADGDIAGQLRADVGALPEPFCETLTLHYFDGYSVREIAGMTGVPEGTVKWRLSEGRNKLRKEYGMNRETINNQEMIGAIMERIRSLRKFFRHDKANFRPEYERILAEIEAMPVSDERDELLMRAKFRGYYYDPELKTPEHLAEIREIAVRLGDEESLFSLCEEEYRFLGDPEKVTKIRDELLPFADAHGWKNLRADLEFDLAQALHDCGDFDEARAYFVRVTENEPADTVRHAIARGGIRVIDELRTADHGRCFTSFGGYGYERRGTKLLSGDYRCYNMYNFGLQFYAACGIFYNYELADRLLHDSAMNPGDSVKAAADDHVLTFVRRNAEVRWDGGTADGCEEWTMHSAGLRTTVYWKRGIGIVREEIERGGRHPERSALVLHEYRVTDDGTMMPFAVGNRWVYRIDMGDARITGTTEYEVLAADGNRANVCEVTKVFEE